MEEKGIIAIIIILSLLSGFFGGSMYVLKTYNLTITQTSVVTVPFTKVVTTTITTTIAAGTQTVEAAPVLNTVFAYKSNLYMVSSNNTIVSIFLPDNYISYAGELANFYSWFNPHYINYVYSKYTQLGLPKMPRGDEENYLEFSSIITSHFKYDNNRAKTIQYDPNTKMPLQVLYDKKGICGDYLHFWALLEIAEGRKVTLVDMFPQNTGVGHAYIIDDNGYVIENNGRVIFNETAALILWYNYFNTPLVLTYFYADPVQGITSFKKTTVYSVPLRLPSNIIHGSHVVTGISNGKGYIETVYINVSARNISITSLITYGSNTLTKYILVQGDVMLIITKDPFSTKTQALQYNENASYAYILPDYLKFRNILNYEEINNSKIYTIQLARGDKLIATKIMNKIIATRFIENNSTIVGIFTYTANVLYS